MSRAGNYATDVASRAIRWRHQRIMRALEHGDIAYATSRRIGGVQTIYGQPTGTHVVPSFTPTLALMLVVWPDALLEHPDLGLATIAARLLDESVAAVGEQEAQAA